MSDKTEMIKIKVQGIDAEASKAFVKSWRTQIEELTPKAIDERVLQTPKAELTFEDANLQKLIDDQYQLVEIIKKANADRSHNLSNKTYEKGLRVYIDLSNKLYTLKENSVKIIEGSADTVAETIGKIIANRKSEEITDKFVFIPSTLEERAEGPAKILDIISGSRKIVSVKDDGNGVYTVTSKAKDPIPDNEDEDEYEEDNY